MPFGDRTGPVGAGPLTGLGKGICGGHGVPGAYRGGRLRGGRQAGFGRGMAMGRGAGWRHRFWQPMEPDVETLADRISMLEQELQAAREQLTQMNPPSGPDTGEES